MTVQVTFQYTMDASSCLVDTCTLGWGAVHGLHLRGELPASQAVHMRCLALGRRGGAWARCLASVMA